MTRPTRVVFYAVNGTGVGHVTRLAAIARWMRRYAAHADAPLEAWFLTSSEADSILFRDGFASFKIPSKTSVGEAGIDRRAYLALAKQWVWHTLGLLRPDLLIVDTFPRGSFGELLSALDLVKRRAFVYRPVHDAVAERPDFQAMMPLYDRILVPEHEADARVRVPESARDRLTFTGPIVARERGETPSREAARARLGLGVDALVVYATAGGGGDPKAGAQLAAAARVVSAIAGAHLVIGAGPLFRGAPIRGPRTLWLSGDDAGDAIAACDLAISAAGYNAYVELMHGGVPTVFVAQEKPADDQRARAARAAASGAAILADADDDAALSRAVAALLDPGARKRASEAARALMPRSHARDAAGELLRLVLPETTVDAAEDAVDDALVGTAIRGGMRVEDVLSIERLLCGTRPRGPTTLAHAVRIVDVAARAGIATETALAAVRTASQEHASPATRARATIAALRASE